MPQGQQGNVISDSAQINPSIVESSDILDDTLLNADINSAAAIAGSKIQALAVGVNAGVVPSTGVADAHVAAAAAIAGSKVQALVVGTNAGVVPSTGVADAHVAADAAIAKTKLNLADTIANADINSAAAINLDKTADSVTRKAITNGTEIIAGTKTFDTIPVLPTSDPTTDNQAVRKLYVDAKIGAFAYVASATLGANGTIDVSWAGTSYTILKVYIIAKPTGAGEIYAIRFNADASSVYESQEVKGQGATASAAQIAATTYGKVGESDQSTTPTKFDIIEIIINQRVAADKKTWISKGSKEGGEGVLICSGVWDNSVNRITRIQIDATGFGGVMASGSKIIVEGTTY